MLWSVKKIGLTGDLVPSECDYSFLTFVEVITVQASIERGAGLIALYAGGRLTNPYLNEPG